MADVGCGPPARIPVVFAEVARMVIAPSEDEKRDFPQVFLLARLISRSRR